MQKLAAPLALLAVVLSVVAPASAAPPTNDEPAQAIVISSFPATFEADTTGATTGPFEEKCYGAGVSYAHPPANAVWYRLQLPEGADMIQVLFEDQGADVILWNVLTSSLDGRPILNRYRCMYAEDDYPSYVGDAQMYLSVGTSLGAEPARIPVTVKIYEEAPIPNDSFDAPTSIESLPYDTEQETWNAHYDEEPAGCVDGSYAWYTYTPATTETIEVSVSSTSGFGRVTASVYALDPDPVTLGCAYAISEPATVVAEAAAGVPVMIGIGGSGALALSVRRVEYVPPSSSDDRADARPLSFGSTLVFDGADATLEPGEPKTCGSGGSIWFELPARPRGATVAVDVPMSIAAVAGDDVLACSTSGTLTLPGSAPAMLVQLRSPGPVEGAISLRFETPLGQQVTDQSPLPDGCGDRTDSVHRNSEVEVSEAVDPNDPDHILVTWQQDRHSDRGGARGIGAAVTFDGGATWTRTTIPGISLCTGGVHLRATDPWAAIDADGTAYVMSLGYDAGPKVGGAGSPVSDYSNLANQVLLNRSDDGGSTWGESSVIASSPGILFNDKETLTADPNTPGLLYAVWDLAPTNQAFPVFARSEDGGRTWTPPVPLPVTGPGAGDQIAVLDDGTIVEIAPRGNMQSISSRDRGVTWSQPTEFGDASSSEGPPGVRGGAGIPSVSTDGRSVFVSWSNVFATYIARSDDAGATWRVESIGTGHPNRSTTAIAATESGRLAVMTLLVGSGFRTHMALATSDDGGASWSESAITEDFDMGAAPHSFGRGYFLGDYFGLVAAGDDVVAAYAAVPQHADGESDVYVLRVTP